MIRKFFIIFAMAFSLACGLLVGGQEQCSGEDAGKKKGNRVKFPRGYKAPTAEVSATRHAMSLKKHGTFLKRLRKATGPKHDCRTTGQVGPVKKGQNQCGDCYIFSASGVCECAQFTALVAQANSGFGLSEQYILDCHPEFGGCDGGDEWEVAQFIMKNGTPSTADAPAGYPGLGQDPGEPKDITGMQLYHITEMGYCTPSAGPNSVAKTQDMKNCIQQYGPISVAVAAGGDWDSYSGGVYDGTDYSGVDHAVIIVGWDDTQGDGGVWIVRNSWGPTWGDKGYMLLPYGMCSIGTEAFWVTRPTIQPPGGGGLVPGTYTLEVNKDGTSTLTPVKTPTPAGATGTYTVNPDGSITLTPLAPKTTEQAAPKQRSCNDPPGKDKGLAPPKSTQERIAWWEKNFPQLASKQ